jgi:chlorite dismutase
VHQVFRIDRRALRSIAAPALSEMRSRARATLMSLARPDDGGWTAVAALAGSKGDVMVMHFRPTLDSASAAQAQLAREPLFDLLIPEYAFLSVTEAGFYHLSAEAEKQAVARGGAAGDDAFRAFVSQRMRAELDSDHVKRRLYPPLPSNMPYVSFYPMSKRRAVGQNWYTQPLAERSRLMMSHGMIGRRYAGKVFQVITGAIGLSAWEWGVTLFAKDPLDFKRLVTDMRFDEASAVYGDFGEFYVGRIVDAASWVEGIA